MTKNLVSDPEVIKQLLIERGFKFVELTFLSRMWCKKPHNRFWNFARKLHLVLKFNKHHLLYIYHYSLNELDVVYRVHINEVRSVSLFNHHISSSCLMLHNELSGREITLKRMLEWLDENRYKKKFELFYDEIHND